MRRSSSFIVAALACAICACSQVQDFRQSVDGPATTGNATAPPSERLDPTCGTVDDASSCGACGHSCLGGACSAGVCQAFVLAEGQGVPADNVSYAGPRALAVDESHAYWTTKSGLFRVPVAGGVTEKLADASAVSTYALNGDDRSNLLILHGEHVYLRAADRRGLVRIPKAGGAIEAVTPAADPDWTVGQFLFHGDRLVWIEQAFINRHVLWACSSLPCDAGGRHEPWAKDDVITGLTLWPATIATAGAELCIGFDPTVAVSGGYGVVCLGGADGKQKLTTGTLPVVTLAAEAALHEDKVTLYGSTAGGIVFRSVLAPGIASTFLPDTVLASGAAAAYSTPLLDAGYLYWLGAIACTSEPCPAITAVVWRVEKSGQSLPEVALRGWGVNRLAVTKEALYFGTDDGKVAKVAKPLPRTKDPLP